MLWWRQINSFMFINTTLEKTILFTLFTGLLMKDLWTGGPQDRDMREGRPKSRKKKGREKKTVAGNGRSKTRAEVHYCLEGAPVFREGDEVKKRACVWVCVAIGIWWGVGLLGVKHCFPFFSLFSPPLTNHPVRLLIKAKTNIVFRSLDLFRMNIHTFPKYSFPAQM